MVEYDVHVRGGGGEHGGDVLAADDDTNDDNGDVGGVASMSGNTVMECEASGGGTGGLRPDAGTVERRRRRVRWYRGLSGGAGGLEEDDTSGSNGFTSITVTSESESESESDCIMLHTGTIGG